MKTKIYHGDLSPNQMAEALLAKFNRGNLRSQKIGARDQVVVQIRTQHRPMSGGQTAITVTLQEVEDGVAVRLGKQSWFGLAASLGVTALTTIKNPFGLIGRLDDLAQDFENLQLSEEIWDTIKEIAKVKGASHLISERLRRLMCAYCQAANPVGEASCLACGAPLGEVHPIACSSCGFVVTKKHATCPNCGEVINP
jgi:hypothetical protein